METKTIVVACDRAYTDFVSGSFKAGRLDEASLVYGDGWNYRIQSLGGDPNDGSFAFRTGLLARRMGLSWFGTAACAMPTAELNHEALVLWTFNMAAGQLSNLYWLIDYDHKKVLGAPIAWYPGTEPSVDDPSIPWIEA